MPPVDCDAHCRTYRIRLYISYSVLLGALILVALVHFVIFLVRRKSKYEAKEYATKKREMNVIECPEELALDGKPISNHSDHNDTEENDADKPANATRSLSTRGSEGHDMIPTPLQRIEEEPSSGNRDVMSRQASSSSSSTPNRNHSVSNALQEPVIVTVATVSALFQHEMHGTAERRSSGEGSAGSSVIDISDLVNSPGCSVRVTNNEDDWNDNDHGDGNGDNLHRSQFQRLDVRVGGGSFSKRHFNNLRLGEVKLEDSLNTDAIFPAGSATFTKNENHH